jgi:hypothetical protein
MTDHPSPAPASPLASWALAAICAVTVGLYALLACTRDPELGNRAAADAYYNQLVDGFRSGQLSLKHDAPAGLAALADPYDPAANGDFRGTVYTDTNRVHDLTYYQGKLYLYFGVTPALLLFWPAAMTGHYVSHQQAVAVFAAVGFLLGVWLLRAVWRRYFPATPAWLMLAGAAALGLANGFPIVLNRPDVWEVPIFCGHALVMLTLVALWQAVHLPEKRLRWLALASLAFGLAVGARPSLLFGGVVLFGPVALGWAEGGPARRRLLAAACGPVVAVGLGLMAYNQLRFGSPFEFGQTYQLAGERQDRLHFSLAPLWFNLRAYFLAPAELGGGFPFVEPARLGAPPAGHGGVETPFGTLAMIPFTWLALALPFAWRGAGRGLACFLALAAGLFGTAVLVLLLYCYTCDRYEVEFLPLLLLLAGVGALALDQGLAARAGWRRAARAAVVVGLVLSVSFNLLAAANRRAQVLGFEGAVLMLDNRVAEAVPLLEQATALKPGLGTAQMTLAVAYGRAGRSADTSARVAEAVRLNPALAEKYFDSYRGNLVLLEAALRQTPDSARLHSEAAVTLAGAERLTEALPHFEAAARLDPSNAGNLGNLGFALAQAGRVAEARAALDAALRLDPSLPGVREVLNQLQPATARPPPLLQR